MAGKRRLYGDTKVVNPGSLAQAANDEVLLAMLLGPVNEAMTAVKQKMIEDGFVPDPDSPPPVIEIRFQCTGIPKQKES